MTECPDCETVFYGESCPCGWLPPSAPQKREAEKTVDIEAIKRSVTAKAQAEAVAWLAERGMGNATTEELRAYARRLAAERPEFPGQEWALRLKSRYADGENLPQISVQFMREFFAKRGEDA